MRPLTWALKEVDPGSPTQAVRHTCSGNLGIVKILCYIRSDMQQKNFGRKLGPLANGALCLSTSKHNGKSGTAEGELMFSRWEITPSSPSGTRRVTNIKHPVINHERGKKNGIVT